MFVLSLEKDIKIDYFKPSSSSNVTKIKDTFYIECISLQVKQSYLALKRPTFARTRVSDKDHRQNYLGVGGLGTGTLGGRSIPHSHPDRSLRLGKASLYATPNLPPPK